MHEILFARLRYVDDRLRGHVSAPTLPIYNSTNLPQDAVDGQLALTTDIEFAWYLNGIWQTQAGVLANGNPPQNAINGQVAIGSDHSLCWFYEGNWYGCPGTIVTGNPPHDAITGQIALGNTKPVWHDEGDWYSFGAVGAVVFVVAGEDYEQVSRYILSDGDTWNLGVDSTFTQQAYAVTHNGAGTVVVLGGGNGLISTDWGNTWDAISGPFPDGFVFGLAWADEPGIFVAVGANGDNSTLVAWSTNGIGWTPAATDFDSNGVLYGVAWSSDRGQFVACGQSDIAGLPIILTSNSGTGGWQAQESPMDNGYGQSVAWSSELGLWVVVGTGGDIDCTILTSPDGITWDAVAIHTAGGPPEGTVSYGYGGDALWINELGLFIVTIADTFAVLNPLVISEDGITWNSYDAPFKNAGAKAITWSNQLQRLGLVTGSPARVYTSADGFTWDQRTPPPLMYNTNDIVAIK